MLSTELGMYILERDVQSLNALSSILVIEFENVMLVGKAFSELNAEYPTYTTVDELYEYLANNPMHQQHILLKGSRGIRLEKLIHLL